MKLFRFFRIGLVIVSLVFFVSAMSAHVAMAAEEEDLADVPEEELQIEPDQKATAGEDRNVAVGRKVLFDASSSIISEGKSVRYLWDFGDGITAEGIDVTHTYVVPGDFTTRLTVMVENEILEDSVVVSVYEDIILLVADDTPTPAQLESLRKQALRQGILLSTVIHSDPGADYVVEGSLVESLLESRDTISRTDIIIVWAKGSLGVNVLSSFASKVEDLPELNFASKGVVVVTDQSLSAISRLAQSAFDSLQPDYVLLTQEESLGEIVTSRTPADVLQEVQRNGIPSSLIGVYSGRASELSWSNFLSYGVNYMINRGIAVENILLLLMLPVIATIVAVSRQVLGVKTFGIYTPSIIALTFVISGLRLGLAVFIVILVVTTAMRYILRWLRLAYLPRMAIVLTAVSAAIFFVLLGGAITQRASITFISIFPFLVLVVLVEKFVTAQAEKGLRSAVLLSLETILIAVAAYYLATWSTFRTFLLAYPEALLLIPLINIAAGKWTGLRVSEYFRFRAVRGSNSVLAEANTKEKE